MNLAAHGETARDRLVAQLPVRGALEVDRGEHAPRAPGGAVHAQVDHERALVVDPARAVLDEEADLAHPRAGVALAAVDLDVDLEPAAGRRAADAGVQAQVAIGRRQPGRRGRDDRPPGRPRAPAVAPEL